MIFLPMLLLLCFLGWIAYYIYTLKLKKEFAAKYNINQLPDKISVRRNNAAADALRFQLHYPSWIYPKKDGTADKRRSWNWIQWGKSTLYLPDYIILASRPFALTKLVWMLRQNGLDIKMCREEYDKYNRIYKEKSLQVSNLDLNKIIESFQDKPTDFEAYCAALYRKMGYKAVVTQATNDGGYDITLEKDGVTAIVECKCYNPQHSISRPLIQKLVGANSTVGADKMIFITTSKFSAPAVEYANSTGVEMLDGEGLLQLLREYALVDSDEVVIEAREWQLTASDMRPYVPQDIFEQWF